MTQELCGHCGMYHQSQVCPRIKSIDYYANGMVKHVEYHTAASGYEPIPYWLNPTYVSPKVT